MDFGGNQQNMDEMSMQISFRLMNSTMKDCFDVCVTDYRTAEMSSNENLCMKNCAARSFSLMSVMAQAQTNSQAKGGNNFWMNAI